MELQCQMVGPLSIMTSSELPWHYNVLTLDMRAAVFRSPHPAAVDIAGENGSPICAICCICGITPTNLLAFCFGHHSGVPTRTIWAVSVGVEASS